MPFNRKDHLNPGEIVPRFKLKSPLKPEEIMSRLKTYCKQDQTVEGKEVLDQFYLDIPKSQRGFWSPELRVSLEVEDEETIVRVLVGPQYTVWVLFIFLYTLLGLISLFGGMYGLTQWTMGHETPWIWCFPITGGLILSLYVIAKIGQKSVRNQTLHLVSCVYHGIGFEALHRIDS